MKSYQLNSRGINRTQNICAKNMQCTSLIIINPMHFGTVQCTSVLLQAWNGHFYSFLVLRGSFCFALHCCTLNISFFKICRVMYNGESQYNPKFRYFCWYIPLYLFIRNETRIFRFLVMDVLRSVDLKCI